jgi:hypothetical protein
MQYIVTCMNDYRQILDCLSDLFYSLIQRVTTIYNSLLHIHAYLSVDSQVFTSRCSVAASNGWRSPSPGFPNYPRALATRF